MKLIFRTLLFLIILLVPIILTQNAISVQSHLNINKPMGTGSIIVCTTGPCFLDTIKLYGQGTLYYAIQPCSGGPGCCTIPGGYFDGYYRIAYKFVGSDQYCVTDYFNYRGDNNITINLTCDCFQGSNSNKKSSND